MDADPTLPRTPATPQDEQPPAPGELAREERARAAARVGTTLAKRYELTGVLGIGGMGAVYSARDRALARAVAVKLVRPSLAEDARVVARFVREARAAAAVAHPALVTVFDVGTDEGTAFLVMELLSGESLAQRLRRTRLDADAAVAIVERVLEGVGAAHAAGVVHRDLKPENVFLCAPDDAARVLDFGIAAVSRRDDAPIGGGDQARLTETGVGLGTPMYVAPEQLRGTPADPRADVYSLGAVLYEALSGQPAYEAATLAELYVKKLTEPPRPLAELAPGVPAPLVAVVARAMHADPARRYADAREMRAALREAQAAGAGARAEGELDPPPYPAPQLALPPPPAHVLGLATPPNSTSSETPFALEVAADARTSGTPSGAVDVAGAPARPRRRAGALLAACASAAVIAAGAGLYFARRAPSPASASAPPREPPARRATARAPQVGLRALEQFERATGAARNLLTAPDLWDGAADDFRRALVEAGDAAPARWRAGLSFCEGRARLLRGDAAGAQAALREATRVEPEWPAPHLALASAANIAGDDAGGVAAARRAQQLAPDWWLPVATLASAHASASRLDEAVQAYRRALALAPSETNVLDGLALALHASHMDSEAERIAADALARDGELVWSRLVLAEVALERGDGAAALEQATRAAAVAPRAAAVALARADALALLRRRDDAASAYRAALALLDQTHQTGVPEPRVSLVRAALARDALPPPRREGLDSPRARTMHRRTRAPSGGGSDRTRSHDAIDSLGL